MTRTPVNGAADRIEALEAENARLREALEWYATCGGRKGWDAQRAVMSFDRGERARTALANTKGSGER